MRSIRLDVEPLALPLKHAFTIARSSEVVARTVLIRLHWNGIDALGEILTTTAFTERVAHFGGYDLSHCGERVQAT